MSGHAGTGEKGFTDDGDDARTAELSVPKGVACAPDGSVCIADTENRVGGSGTSHGRGKSAPRPSCDAEIEGEMLDRASVRSSVRGNWV